MTDLNMPKLVQQFVADGETIEQLRALIAQLEALLNLSRARVNSVESSEHQLIKRCDELLDENQRLSAENSGLHSAIFDAIALNNEHLAREDLLKAALRWCIANEVCMNEFNGDLLGSEGPITPPPEFAAVIAEAVGSKNG